MKFIDFFCGIGTIRMGMEKAGYECVYSVEWDKHKRGIYNVIFGSEPEGKDIRQVRGFELPRADCWCFGAPCQDFSIAGKREGLEGDRSSLVREIFRLLREVEEEYRPKYLFYENVKGMLSSNKGFDFLEILSEMASVGYDRIEYSLLNSKNYGVPHNRERVYTAGHLRGASTRKIFPIGETTTGNLEQLNNPSHSTNRLYSSNGIARCLRAEAGGKGAKTGLYLVGNTHPSGKGMNGNVWDSKGFCPALTTNKGEGMKVLVREATKKGYAEVHEGDSINLAVPGSKTRRGRVGKCVANTLDTSCNQGTLIKGRIRRLTPKECWRLQGISDEITDKVRAAGISDSQMYRGAGDACTVNVIYEIARRMS
ncbi:DNA cytosine methyltransferase [Clostridium tunisiense]|uniref:DNA cytosine methyltransferase n=1 Tax=Clostridium tunisiense TaxID=219748 RepID=UPI00037EF2DD|nr:DNA cytosine methyltransferase [Clostridium tunisiense]